MQRLCQGMGKLNTHKSASCGHLSTMNRHKGEQGEETTYTYCLTHSLSSV